MSWIPWLQSLLTFRKDTGNGLVVPRLDSSGRIRVVMDSGVVDDLDDIGDVNAPTPNDNDVLSYDTATNKWIADTAIDPDAIHNNVAGEISTITEKLAPLASDTVLVEDSAAGNIKKKIQIGNLLAGGNYAQLVSVAKSGGQYTTIMGAINSITDASPIKQYAVLVYPGLYPENIVMKDYVDIIGIANNLSIISPTSGTAVNFDGSSMSNLIDMGVSTSYGTLTQNTDTIVCTSGMHQVTDCYISTSSTGGNYSFTAINHSGGSIYFRGTYIGYTRSGGSSSLNQSVINTSFTGFSVVGCNITPSMSGGNESLAGVTFSASSGDVVFDNNRVVLSNTSGDAYGMKLTAGSVNVSKNLIDITASGDAYGGVVSGTGVSFKTSHNIILVSSTGGNAYSGTIGVGSSWDSKFDYVVAADGYAGSGAAYFLSSISPGSLVVSDYITNGYNFLTVANLNTAFAHTSLTNNPHSVTTAQIGAAEVTDTAPVNITKAAAVVGTSSEAARQDHKHDITTATASAQVPGDIASEGSAISLARSDHKHNLPAYGATSATICQGNDSRLSDARTPTSHASSHQSGGSDSIKLDDLDVPDDNTDLNATTSLHGLLPKLGGGTSDFLRADGTWSAPPGGSYQQHVSVAKAGGDYSTIQGAIDSITDAASDKLYVVHVYPGDYDENVVLKDYVDLVGDDPGSCKITPTTGAALTFSGTVGSRVQHIGIECVYGAMTQNQTAIVVSGGAENILYHCTVNVSSTSGEFVCKAIDHTGGGFSLALTQINYNRAGGTGSLSQIAIATSFPGLALANCSLVVIQTSGTDTLYAAQFTGSATSGIFGNNQVYVNNSGGDAYGWLIANGSHDVDQNVVTVLASDDAYGGVITGSGTTINTRLNSITVASTGGGNGYAGDVASGCFWNSYLDIRLAADGSIGAGTVTYCSMVGPGTLALGSSLVLPGAAVITDGVSTFVTAANLGTAYNHSQLTTGNPHSVTAADVGAAGVSDTAPVNVTKATASAGVSVEAARQDHKHDVTVAAASVQVLGDSASEGSATSLARSDHKHGLPSYGTGSGTVCQGNDSRLSDARTPTSHASSHLSGAGDAIKLDDLAAPEDNTDLNASTSAHGLLRKLGGGTTNYLRADGSWSEPPGTGGIYGSNFQQGSSDAQSTTTSGTYQQKLRVTTASLPIGTYRIGWFYEWGKSTLTDVAVRVQVNDTTTVLDGYEEAADGGADQYYPRGGFGYYTGSGVLNLDLDYHANATGTARIRKARLEIWRVA